MPRSLQYDRQLFGVTLALCFIGAVMVFSASAVMSRETYGNAYAFLFRQLIWLGLGVAGMLVLMNADYRRLRQPRTVLTALSVTILLLLLVFLFDRAHATHRWIRYGAIGIQPSEFAKLSVILYLAWFLESRSRQPGFNINDVRRTLAPALGPILLIMVLVLIEPDMGTAAMLLFVAMAMLFVMGFSLRYLFGAILAAIPIVYLLIVRVPYRYARMMAFLFPSTDPQGRGFQLIQSLIAVGSGGLTGVGLMDSRQKLFYLPEAHTDFIFAVLSEELGFIGALIVVALFAWYAWRGLRTAWRAPDQFGRLLALGITVLVAGQALINLSVVLGLMPTKGIPLPFISYGGSSLLVMLLATGVLLNISQHAE
jgi:cell division protein FtsW